MKTIKTMYDETKKLSKIDLATNQFGNREERKEERLKPWPYCTSFS